MTVPDWAETAGLTGVVLMPTGRPANASSTIATTPARRRHDGRANNRVTAPPRNSYCATRLHAACQSFLWQQRGGLPASLQDLSQRPSAREQRPLAFTSCKYNA